LKVGFKARSKAIMSGGFAICSVVWALDAVLLTQELETQLFLVLGATVLLAGALWFSVVE